MSRAGCGNCADGRLERQVGQLNRRVIQMLSGLIMFKKRVLREVLSCRLYTANYLLMIEYIIRKANHYLRILEEKKNLKKGASRK
ncbi:DUF2935 domain-containing protein [Ruminococcus turbiniformis]|uniref:DUF2935 domain-containing protein n=1 Tax=Ruminococcus turbiniformis TaxID=2881258 RepID=UPI00389AED10